MADEPVNPESQEKLIQTVKASIPALVNAANALSGNPSARGDVKLELERTVESLKQALRLVKRLEGDSENPAIGGKRKRSTRRRGGKRKTQRRV